jgi:hypothetical protein
MQSRRPRPAFAARIAPLSPALAQHGQRLSAPATPEACLRHVTPEACLRHVTPEACLRHDGGRIGAHPRTVAARALSQRIVQWIGSGKLGWKGHPFESSQRR